MKGFIRVSSLLLLSGIVLFGVIGSAYAEWPGNRPITTVIWYRAGGGTDMNMRTLTKQMEQPLGATINCINKPGAIGSLAMDFVRSKPNDGYWWMGAVSYGGQLRIMGYTDLTCFGDWQYYKSANSTGAFSVKVDSPFKTMADFVAACRKEPGKYKVSNSGVGGTWHQYNVLFKRAAKIEWQEVPYKGGAPGVLACLQGEVDVASSGLHEAIEFYRAGKMRNLGIFREDPIKLKDGTVLRPLKDFVPELNNELFGLGGYTLGVRRDTPVEILEKIKKAFVGAVNSPEYTALLDRKYFTKNIMVGEKADRAGALYESVTAWLFWDLKMQGIKKSPAELGIPKPEDFNKWWPPKGYKPRISSK